MIDIINDRPVITIDFTVDEMVTMLSCCNQAIINIEDTKHTYTPAEITISRGITLEKSRDKIWAIKSKLKKSIISSLGESTKNGIKVGLDITEWIKLNGCCNAAIEMEEKTIDLLPSTSKCITTCKETIQEISDIKNKIKITLNSIYSSYL